MLYNVNHSIYENKKKLEFETIKPDLIFGHIKQPFGSWKGQYSPTSSSIQSKTCSWHVQLSRTIYSDRNFHRQQIRHNNIYAIIKIFSIVYNSLSSLLEVIVNY